MALLSRLTFFKEVVSELRKVVWPSRETALRFTTIVILISVAMGLILGVVDFAFTRFVTLLFR